MPDETTIVLGIPVPSTDPVFLTLVGFHVVLGITCVISGAIAMLSYKRAGRHPAYGTIYFWSLAALVTSATLLAMMRWAEDYHLFVLGSLSLTTAIIGRRARRKRWQGWVTFHIVGMSMSYIVMLTAFYVDNGPSLPLWQELPAIALWLLPSAIGMPLMAYALLRYSRALRAKA
jgi:hypothetical protein